MCLNVCLFIPTGRIYVICAVTGAQTSAARAGHEHLDHDGVHLAVSDPAVGIGVA